MNTDPRTADAMSAVFQRINNRTPREWLRAAHRIARRSMQYRGQPLWSFVSDMTSHGSTYSMEICKRFGWDAWAPVNKDLPDEPKPMCTEHGILPAFPGDECGLCKEE